MKTRKFYISTVVAGQTIATTVRVNAFEALVWGFSDIYNISEKYLKHAVMLVRNADGSNIAVVYGETVAEIAKSVSPQREVAGLAREIWRAREDGLIYIA